MSLSLQDVEKIAGLARLALTDAEKLRYQEQLSAVLDYAERLNELDTTGVPPTASAVNIHSVMREDIVEPSLTVEDVLFNTVQHSQNQFQIQAALDENVDTN
jgi:aspartyl-tRNA(Asn)/glutamyl-tRNA(Gln) amidotransferase subunit C